MFYKVSNNYIKSMKEAVADNLFGEEESIRISDCDADFSIIEGEVELSPSE